jgi:hypothetical protein
MAPNAMQSKLGPWIGQKRSLGLRWAKFTEDNAMVAVTRIFAEYSASIQYGALPEAVQERTRFLLLDLHIGSDLEPARQSSRLVLAGGIVGGIVGPNLANWTKDKKPGLAFGASFLIVGETCGSPFQRRAVSGSMGTIFEQPVVQVESLGELCHLPCVLRLAERW